MGDVRVVAAVALHLVEDLEEDGQDGVPARAVVGLAVDVEEDDVGVRGDGPLDVAEEHGILDLGLEELDRPPRLARRASGSAVPQQVRQDLDEVRLARAEEAGDPDADSPATSGSLGFLMAST